MSKFENALEFVLPLEGGYNNIKEDAGGATNYGISLRFLKSVGEDLNGDGHVDINDIVEITHSQSAELYKKYFWDHYKLYNIQDQFIANRAFSFFVNMRGKTAATIFQRAVRACGFDIVEDGILGTKSFNLINSIHPSVYLPALRSEAAAVYRLIVANNQTQSKFLNGWLKRAYL